MRETIFKLRLADTVLARELSAQYPERYKTGGAREMRGEIWKRNSLLRAFKRKSMPGYKIASCRDGNMEKISREERAIR